MDVGKAFTRPPLKPHADFFSLAGLADPFLGSVILS
jgi:hypothetical protein